MRIEKYNALAQTTSLLLIKKIDDYYEIYPFQFIASCKVEEIDQEILVGFYLGEYNEFECFPLTEELPSKRYFSFSVLYGQEKFIIDYASYQKICSLTGEPCWNIAEYIAHKEEAPDGAQLNTLFLRDGKLRPNGTNTL